MAKRMTRGVGKQGTSGSKPGSKSEAVGARNKAASGPVAERIRAVGGWREETLSEVRRLIRAADPEIVEEVKWKKPSNPLGVPVWSHAGIVCTGEVYKQTVKLTFARGASLADPSGLFNASLEGKTRRAIDIREGEKLDARAFRALVKSAVAENVGRSGGAPARKREKRRVVLLSGGNPQIAKGEGEGPVRAYIAAMSGGGAGWKRDLGERLDALMVRSVPGVRKAVKWNSPFYGVEGRGWFLSFHVFTRYVKVTFFKGTSLRPRPPGGTERSGEARWVDVYEDGFDEAQMERWVRQAAKLRGWEA